MSFTYKRRGSKRVLYFQAGRTGTLYIMPKDSPEDVKVENVEKALKYMQSRMEKDNDIYRRLIDLLPQDRRAAFEKFS